MRILAAIGALAIIVAVAMAVFFFGGYFNVAATQEDPAPVRWALIKVRMNSIDRYATDKPPANFDDAARMEAGARLYALHGCTSCHGGPGVEWAKFSEGLQPPPPELKEQAIHLSPPQLHWIVKHGINMTGMPAFQAHMKDDELWSVAAFLKKFDRVTEADYKRWTAQPAAAAPPAQPAAPEPPPAQPAPANPGQQQQ
jgi:mono/diheme cytochrome c family protein